MRERLSSLSGPQECWTRGRVAAVISTKGSFVSPQFPDIWPTESAGSRGFTGGEGRPDSRQTDRTNQPEIMAQVGWPAPDLTNFQYHEMYELELFTIAHR